eukprot:TRINITY_DN1494_c0_g1_i5.p1 TRINITY_DN1494_c0_g1~~TRINITY_DN1494_c0_g1_i5.p1  ORF type:complete len:344 (-),score=87.34 TRINITY_DN1494_c0_g1_i5:53-1084(-)
MQEYRFGGKPDLDDITLREVERPRAGPNQVVVKMKAASLNSRDVQIATCKYPLFDYVPRVVPLSDGAGIIDSVGEGVKKWREGDRVCPIFSSSWINGNFHDKIQENGLGGGRDGVLSQYYLCDQESLVKMPSNLSFEEASTLPCAALTAWHSLFGYEKKVQPGDWVLVLGSGGVSIFGLQFAKAAGAYVIATTSSNDKGKRLKELGADHVVNYKEHPKWHEEVRKITPGGRGVDHVIEIGGMGSLAQSIQSCAPEAQIGIIGYLAEKDGQEEVDIAKLILVKYVSVRGVLIGSRDTFEAMNRAIEANNIKPVVDKVFSFKEAKDAFKHMKDGSYIGKIVIAID